MMRKNKMNLRIIKETVNQSGYSSFTVSNDEEEYLRLEACELLQNDKLLAGFSIEDVKQICYSAACTNLMKQMKLKEVAA